MFFIRSNISGFFSLSLVKITLRHTLSIRCRGPVPRWQLCRYTPPYGLLIFTYGHSVPVVFKNRVGVQLDHNYSNAFSFAVWHSWFHFFHEKRDGKGMFAFLKKIEIDIPSRWFLTNLIKISPFISPSSDKINRRARWKF